MDKCTNASRVVLFFVELNAVFDFLYVC